MEIIKQIGPEMEFVKPENIKLVSGAVGLVNHFSSKGLVLPTTEKHYMSLAEQKKLVAAKDVNGKVIGTAAYTQVYPNDVWEFGGWVVDSKYQKSGLGMSLLKKLLLGNKHWKTIAFGNANSAPIFKKIGAMVVKDHSIIPGEAFALCSDCKNKPPQGCCDTIFSLTRVIVNWSMEGMSPRQVERLIYGIGENAIGGFGGLDENWAGV